MTFSNDGGSFSWPAPQRMIRRIVSLDRAYKTTGLEVVYDANEGYLTEVIIDVMDLTASDISSFWAAFNAKPYTVSLPGATVTAVIINPVIEFRSSPLYGCNDSATYSVSLTLLEVPA